MSMQPWLETGGVVTLGALGVWLGRWFSRRPRPYWAIGYFIPLGLIVLIGLGYRFRTLEFMPPFSWLMAGRSEFALSALIGTMVLTTPLSRLPLRRDRVVVSLLMVCVVFLVSGLPFLAPAFNREKLAALKTRTDADGICLQNTDYTCGPAAAVTALRRLGLAAEEGEIAQFCRTSAAMGTPPDIMCRTLQKRYGSEGLTCEYRRFKSVADLKQSGYTLALIKFGLLLDHYVTVLEVGARTITVGDPLTGKETLTHEEFAKKWRFVGVVVNRKT
jgi:hypothetical protein